MKPRFIDIDGKRYLWSDVIELRRTQLTAWRKTEQPNLFELRVDYRPQVERTALGRYIEPSLFDD